MLFQGWGSKYPLISICWVTPRRRLSTFLDFASLPKQPILCLELSTCLFIRVGRNFMAFVFEKLDLDFVVLIGGSSVGVWAPLLNWETRLGELGVWTSEVRSWYLEVGLVESLLWAQGVEVREDVNSSFKTGISHSQGLRSGSEWRGYLRCVFRESERRVETGLAPGLRTNKSLPKNKSIVWY